MPYKVVGKTVYVKRGAKWVKLKAHETHEAALKHLAALKRNVEHK